MPDAEGLDSESGYEKDTTKKRIVICKYSWKNATGCGIEGFYL